MWGDWAAACCFYADIGTVAQKSIRWKVFTKHSLVLYTFGCTISIGYMWRHWCSMAWLSILGRKVTHAYSMVACRTFNTHGWYLDASYKCILGLQSSETNRANDSFFCFHPVCSVWLSIHSQFMCGGTECDSIDCWRFVILHGLIHSIG